MNNKAQKLYEYDSSNKFGTKNHWFYINRVSIETQRKAHALEKAYTEEELNRILIDLEKDYKEYKNNFFIHRHPHIASTIRLMGIATGGLGSLLIYGLLGNKFNKPDSISYLTEKISKLYDKAIKEHKIKIKK